MSIIDNEIGWQTDQQEGSGLLLSTLLALIGTIVTSNTETTCAEPYNSPDDLVISSSETPPTISISEKEDDSLPGMLYPRESESREVKSLDGFWDFMVSPSGDALKGYRDGWFSEKLEKIGKPIKMPVPSSYNDVTTSSDLRDHVGAVWYQRSFFVPNSWAKKRVFVRFGSVNYLAQVWLNGDLITGHEMGHLPFEAELGSSLLFDKENIITVAVDNTLLPTTVPQGKVNETPTDRGTILQQSFTFDFFNYAGIHRPVLLHTKPRVFVDDITIKTSIADDTGFVKYAVDIAGLEKNETPNCIVTLRDANGTIAVEDSIKGLSGTLKVPSAKFWWPRNMDPEPGYLYMLEVRVRVNDAEEEDVYRLPVGIRTVGWTNTTVLINNKPIYLRGFGRHEDSAIRGRGLDLVTVARDHELLEWVGANAYRTSHYPYSEEVLDTADRLGFLIVDECPSVNTEIFSSTLLFWHKQSISELIRRDKNRPSVFMWSIANEPRTQFNAAENYFKQVAEHTKALDPSRPITIAIAQSVQDDKSAQFLDVVGFNRYNAWYANAGHLDMIQLEVEREAEAWHQKHNKPVLMFEYGADTMPGLHELPAYIWSEEYQTELFSKHFRAFDNLRKKGFFVGEFIWNFADFRTAQTYTRVGGNKKGIFTRDRQPKEVAHLVRRRYHSLAAELDKVTPPKDLEDYVAPFYNRRTEF